MGGVHALSTIVPAIPAGFPVPLMVAHHTAPESDDFLVQHLAARSQIVVKEALDKTPIEPGVVYIAPPAYHLQVERDRRFSLSVDAKVNYSRPSIDVLFLSASDVYRERLIGIVLTGANSDGSHGLRVIKERGGLAIVENPETAEAPYMPGAAAAACQVDHILEIDQIAPILESLVLVSDLPEGSHRTARSPEGSQPSTE